MGDGQRSESLERKSGYGMCCLLLHRQQQMGFRFMAGGRQGEDLSMWSGRFLTIPGVEQRVLSPSNGEASRRDIILVLGGPTPSPSQDRMYKGKEEALRKTFGHPLDQGLLRTARGPGRSLALSWSPDLRLPLETANKQAERPSAIIYP
jgi:hypothetical protein